MNHSQYMQLALEEAHAALTHNEIPVGAVVVNSEGAVIARAHNRVIERQDCTAHAEVEALRTAGKYIGNYRLDGCHLYVTLEPCPMCAMALVHARIDTLIFAARDFQYGAAGSVYNICHDPHLNHRIEIHEGPLQKESSELLTSFFHARR